MNINSVPVQSPVGISQVEFVQAQSGMATDPLSCATHFENRVEIEDESVTISSASYFGDRGYMRQEDINDWNMLNHIEELLRRKKSLAPVSTSVSDEEVCKVRDLKSP